MHTDSYTWKNIYQVNHCSVLFSLREWSSEVMDQILCFPVTHTHEIHSMCSTKHGNTTNSIMAVRILPCLGTSSCPVVPGRRLNWWSPPRLVLLLLCQSQLQIIIHLCLQATELGNFSSLSSTSVTFSKPFCSLRPSSSLSGSPVRTKHTHSGQSTNSSSCLHLQFIFPLTRQRKCLPPR